MIRSFFTTAIRQLLKNKWYTILNIFGLSIGLACFTLIGLWVKDELSYDKFHTKADRIFRIAGTFTDESGQFDQAVTCIPLAPALTNDLPEIEDAVRIDVNGALVQLGDKQFIENDIQAVDPSFFNIFDFKLLHGDKATALNEPYNLILSESMAKKYFGDRNPVGELLKIFQYDPDGKGADYKITGVIEDCPPNSHFNYNFLFSFKTIEKVNPNAFGYDGWFNNGYYTYALVKPGANLELLQGKLETFLDKYIGTDMKKHKVRWTYFLQSLPDIHLNSHLRYEIKPTSSVSYVVIFGSIGIIVLLLACINYVNLSTAYSSDRFKEVGVRKVMGAYKSQLVAQYLVEAWMLAMISLITAIAWIELARPLFESLTGQAVRNLYSVTTLTALVCIGSAIGIVSGIYPSLVMSSFKIVNVLKGQFKAGFSRTLLRKGLVVVQYAISIVLITGILVIQLQLKFIDKKDLGFNKDNLLVLNVNGSREVVRGYENFKNELLSNPAITDMSRSGSMIAGGLGNTVVNIIDPSGKKINGTIFLNNVDQDYVSTYGMKLLAGRDFIKGSRADSSGIIVNEATAKTYGYQHARDAVGAEAYFGETKTTIIGVVKDFHYASLQQKIEPTCIYLLNGGFSRIAVRLEGDVHTAVEIVQNAWHKHFPNTVPDYSFAEDRLQKQYLSEKRFSKIFLIFSCISLVIACLGLFSLVSYSVEGRTKEIGIRKVLGASIADVVNMISREFLLLILIACAIAIPVAYYFMQQWLQQFAYRISLGVEVFMIAAAVSIIIACVTISIKSVRSALTNPVDSLRNE